ncbi:DUF4328 domain-containing protein [Actinomadura sp. HBU206391]|uniref:DUF4328 domain-containing protein n=1 Tax=Actinomadura sp. HBU206391 TaxID=2731692 RepID=UPI001650BA28|nr:DUF4328 domain-containing protein [Actinomadura sp. HBU206391]MBC6462247.1 DUF4328 domain-containing protein [Actinomadura sp. HBU206391]
MPCALCGDIIPTQVDRCPACGALARRRDYRALGVAVFMLLGFNAFIALGSGVSMTRMVGILASATNDSYDPAAAGRMLAPYSDLFTTSATLAMVTAVLYLPWLWLAYRNAAEPRRYRQAWVVASWLCPVVNLWLPPRLVYDAWVRSGRFRLAERHAIAAVVAAWWAGLLSALCLMWLFPRSHTETIAEARFAVHLGIVATTTLALSAALCMMTVFGITRLQMSRPA